MGFFDRLWQSTGSALFGDGDAAAAGVALERARAAVPVVWLLGKTGAGKTSIVAALTGDTRAEVGEGFEPCTRTASFYDVPPEAPLLRFLDTRGLGETGYDPKEDIGWCESQAHLLLVVMQADDPGQQAVRDAVIAARRRHPDWPVVAAQTGLHRLYPTGAAHPEPYPYTGGTDDRLNPAVPRPLRQALDHQRRTFAEGLPGPAPCFVPLDFTLSEDGFQPEDFGLEALWRALEAAGTEGVAALRRAQADAGSEGIRAETQTLIYGYAAAAGAAGVIPVPLVGLGGLGGLLALMLRTLAGRYGTAWTPGMFAQFTGAVGGGTLLGWGVRYGLRELLKLIPVVGSWAGAALNAAASFALTVGIGEAARVWLSYHRRGLAAPSEEVRRAFAEGLAEALREAKRRRKLRKTAERASA